MFYQQELECTKCPVPNEDCHVIRLVDIFNSARGTFASSTRFAGSSVFRCLKKLQLFSGTSSLPSFCFTHTSVALTERLPTLAGPSQRQSTSEQLSEPNLQDMATPGLGATFSEVDEQDQNSRLSQEDSVGTKVLVLVVDGVSRLPPEANGAIVIGGSNAAIYATYFSAKAGARAAIHHDCGIGRDEAGITGLRWADEHGMAMAAVATDSARVGDGADMLHRGVISRANNIATMCGVEQGQTVRQAVELLRSAPWPYTDVEAPVEGRTFLHGVLCMDSISLATLEDTGLVVASGSHGGAITAGMTCAFRPRLVLFNDAGFGADRAGAASLPILDSEGIAAATVSADSACIGNGVSTLTQGRISAVNRMAYQLGARVAAAALDVAMALK